MTLAAALVLALSAVFPVDDEGSADPDRWTLPHDPVFLIDDGREVAGRADLAETRGRFTYRFADEANRAAFLADPGRYEIRMGGACARMGPLSGVGRADLHVVHDEALYVFASQACREGFLEAADRLIETADEPVTADAASRERAARLIDGAVAAMGGADRVDQVSAVRERFEEPWGEGDEQVSTGDAVLVVFPDRIRRDSWWGDWNQVARIDGERAELIHDGTHALAPAQQLAVRRIAWRQPLALLRARHRADFVAAAEAPARVGERTVERVRVSFDGITTTLHLDPESGELVGLSYRGRGPSRAFGRVEEDFHAFTRVDGLRLPSERAVRFDGEPWPKMSRTLGSIEVDPPTVEREFEAR